jgi:hypothetical protein
MLRELEWVQHEGEMGATPAFCPSCDAWETDGHREGCGLDELLVACPCGRRGEGTTHGGSSCTSSGVVERKLRP